VIRLILLASVLSTVQDSRAQHSPVAWYYLLVRVQTHDLGRWLVTAAAAVGEPLQPRRGLWLIFL